MKALIQWIHSLTGASPLMYAAVGVGLLVAVLYFRIIFGGFGGFRQDVENDVKTSILDKNYDYVNSRWSRLKIMIWILLSVGSGAAAYHQLPEWFPHLFKAP